MSSEHPHEPDERWLYRVGGLSAIALGIGYVVIIPLFLVAGAPPAGGGEAWLAYGAGKTAAWWAIIGLSVLTDILFVPLALALYLALKGVGRDAMLVGVSLVMLFVVVDLAVTWPNFAVLVSLSDRYAAAGVGAERAAYIAAATYASAVLTSTLEAVYSILTLAIGILLIGIVMLRSAFSRTGAYLALGTGILGILSVIGGFFVTALGTTVILASVLTTAWVLVVGYRLYRLGQH